MTEKAKGYLSMENQTIQHPDIGEHEPLIVENPYETLDDGSEKVDKKKKERNGGVIGTIFNFTNAPMGAGMLSFPYTFYCTGLFAGIIISGVVIILTLLTLHILTDLNQNYYRKKIRDYAKKKDRIPEIEEKQKNGEKLTKEEEELLDPMYETTVSQKFGGFESYQSCIEFYVGKWWKKLCEFILLFYATGILVVYFLVIGQFIKPCIDAWAPLPTEFFHNQRLIIIGAACSVIFPLLMVRQISKLWFTSFIAIGGALSLSLFTCITGILAIVNGNMGPGQKRLLWLQTRTTKGYPLIFLAIPLKCFGYQSHVLMFPILYAMTPSKSRRKYVFVFVISIAMVSCIYMTNGLFGWFAFGANVKDNILNNFSGSNIAANLIRLACGINILFSFPVQNFAARLALVSIFFGSGDKRLGTFSHIIISGVYFSINLVCALFIPGLSVLFGFVGALGATSLMFFFPSLLTWWELTVVYGKKSLFWKIFYYLLSIFLFVVWIFFSVTGFISAVFKFIAAINDGEI